MQIQHCRDCSSYIIQIISSQKALSLQIPAIRKNTNDIPSKGPESGQGIVAEDCNVYKIFPTNIKIALDIIPSTGLLMKSVAPCLLSPLSSILCSVAMCDISRPCCAFFHLCCLYMRAGKHKVVGIILSRLLGICLSIHPILLFHVHEINPSRA